MSHECLEMLVNPFGSQEDIGPSPLAPERGVRFNVQVCDPCAVATYVIDGVEVADFVTAAYYSAPGDKPGDYSYHGTVTAPRELIRGAWISWWDPADHHIYRRLHGATDGSDPIEAYDHRADLLNTEGARSSRSEREGGTNVSP